MEYQLISLLIDHLTGLKDRKNANFNSSFRADLSNTISMLKQLRKYWQIKGATELDSGLGGNLATEYLQDFPLIINRIKRERQ